MLKRKVDEKLKFWKQNRKQALLVTGARQIGKTFSILNFLNNNFENVIVIDFSKCTDLVDSFALLVNSNDLLLRLSLVAGDKLVPGKTAIFFDEIQIVYKRRDELKKKDPSAFPSQDIVTAMKEMVIQGEYRFIISGSLLRVTLKDVNLYPTGYMDEIRMFPLDFEEFLWAKGVGDAAISDIKTHFENKTPVDESINKLFLDYFRQYVLIGGMPEAVESFINSNNLYLVNEIQSQILSRYKLDVTTYIDDDGLKLRVRDIYQAIPSQLSSKNMRFISSQVLDKKYLKSNNAQDEFLWLVSSGIAIPTYNVSEPVIPLSLSAQRKVLKLFYSDTGLLISSLVDSNIREKLLNNEEVINYGAPYENVAACELSSHGFNDSLYYFNSKTHGEVDFVIEYKGDVLPIEIKSGKPSQNRIYNHSSLNGLIKKYNYKEAYVFGNTNIIKESDVIYQLPIYMIDFIRK